MRKPLSLLSPTLRHKLDESPEAVGSVPFGQLVGGVLTACIEAQGQASELAWQYTKEALFQDDPFEEQVTTVTFTYVENAVEKSITIPLLTLVPAPYLKMDDIDLDFNAQVSVDNSDQYTLMANVGSSQTDMVSLQTASMDTNLHIQIKAHAGQPPAGLLSFLRMVGDNGIIIEDDSELSSTGRASHHIDGELQLDQILLATRGYSQGSGGRPLSVVVSSIRAGVDGLTCANKPLPIIGSGGSTSSGSGRRGLGGVIGSISSGAQVVSSQGSGSGRRGLGGVIGSISSGAQAVSSQGSGSGRRGLGGVIGSISSGAQVVSSQGSGSGRRGLGGVIGSISNNSKSYRRR